MMETVVGKEPSAAHSMDKWKTHFHSKNSSSTFLQHPSDYRLRCSNTSGHVGRRNVINYPFKITNSIGGSISICYMLCHYITYQFAALGTFHTDTSQRCSRNGFSQTDCLKHPVSPDAHPPLVTLCCYRTCAP